ncbi:DNA methyltransferase [Microbacterium sp.]|uniref:DNA-methyltransferase n=1 Tax=Microbacterium sp. TaxID=51671 RepID=UPI0026213AAB|nr:DNA methyltransferase [Microbacterium sp.]
MSLATPPALFETKSTVRNHATDDGFVELTSGFQAQVTTENGTLHQGDSLDWLRTLATGTADLVFADPPYNINKAVWDKFDSHDAYVDWSLQWIEQAARVLKPSGSLYVCGFTEILADIKHPAMANFADCKWLIWHYKNKANLGSDWGRSHESIIHFRKSAKHRLPNPDFARIPYGAHTLKYPSHPQAETSNFGKGGTTKRDNWEPHPMGAKAKDVIEIPTTSNGMAEKTPHPTQKPEELLRKFVMASTNRGDLVIDPFSGSGTTAVVAEQLGRRWMACDLSSEYNGWAAQRLVTVRNMSEAEWFAFDRSNAMRRDSIR